MDFFLSLRGIHFQISLEMDFYFQVKKHFSCQTFDLSYDTKMKDYEASSRVLSYNRLFIYYKESFIASTIISL